MVNFTKLILLAGMWVVVLTSQPLSSCRREGNKLPLSNESRPRRPDHVRNRMPLTSLCRAGQLPTHEGSLKNPSCRLGDRISFSKILFDCLAVEGELSVVDRYEIGEGIAEYCKSQSMIPSVALLGKLPTVTGFCAQVAWNRALDVKVFSKRQVAREWLNRFGPQPRHRETTGSRTLESKPALIVKIRLPRI
jgi:hypothetical protein